MKQAVVCHTEALAGGGVGGRNQVGPLGGTTVRGGAAVGDDGGQLGERRGGRLKTLFSTIFDLMSSDDTKETAVW